MDCGFNINHILPEEITLLDASADFWKNTCVGGGREFMRQQICTVIDRIGEGSAQSQGFLTPITTSQKLRASDHRLYILKDPNANQYRGGVIGYMKVARKKLNIQDAKGQQKEYQPCCLLDFFIDPPYQRQGHGQKLLNFVLKREHVSARDIVIDKPSQKCLSFFSHKYNLVDTIRQPTPFVVFADFFVDNANQGVTAPPEKETNIGPLEKTYNGFYNNKQSAPSNNNNGYGSMNGNQSTVNGDYGRSQSSDKPSPTENNNVMTADMIKEKQIKSNLQPVPDVFRSSLRPTKGMNQNYSHTQLW